MAPITITYLTPTRFFAPKQAGIHITQEWHTFLRWLTWPSYADDKREHGAWCPAALEGGIVRGGSGPVAVLVADVDDCSKGAIDRTASLLRPYAGAVVPTFNATPEQPKHRIVLLPSRSIQPEEFGLAWTKMAAELTAAGVVLDRGCKNINRLYYACVTRAPETWLGARLLEGSPIDVDGMLCAAREEEEYRRARCPTARPVGEQHRDKYIAAAIRGAQANVSSAGAGTRHDVLLRESFGLARFGLSEDQIADALLEDFVAAAGEARRREGERAIRDAVSARQQVAV